MILITSRSWLKPGAASMLTMTSEQLEIPSVQIQGPQDPMVAKWFVVPGLHGGSDVTTCKVESCQGYWDGGSQ